MARIWTEPYDPPRHPAPMSGEVPVRGGESHPSGRQADAASAVAAGEVASRHEVQRWHERLPLYLREEPKRLKVVAALSEALRRVEAGEL